MHQPGHPPAGHPTLFERIASGDIPASLVYEDASVFAFLDIGPVAPGHTLLVPRLPAATLMELDEASAAALGRALPRLSRALTAATGCDGLNVLQNNGSAAGQVVPHVHFHLIPRFNNRDERIGLRWDAGELDAEQAQSLRDRIKDAMIQA